MSYSNPHKRSKLGTAMLFAISFYQLFLLFLLEIRVVFLYVYLLYVKICIVLSAEIKLVSLKLVSYKTCFIHNLFHLKLVSFNDLNKSISMLNTFTPRMTQPFTWI